jgi:hypothetical protein
MSSPDFIQKRRQNIAKGVVIASARREQLAVDFPFNDFSAGAFSYVFTQYLWQRTQNESVSKAIFNVRQSTNNLAREKGILQDPQFESHLTPENTNAPIYFTPQQALPAEAVITQVKGNEVELWLGGLDPSSLEAFTNDPYFVALDASGNMSVIFPLDWSATDNAMLIQPSQKRVIPQVEDGFKLTIVESIGISEALIIASTTPLRSSLQALQKIADSRGLRNKRSPIPVSDDILGFTNNLLDDLNTGTRGDRNSSSLPLPAGVRGIDTEKLAAMAIAFQVIR